MLCGPFRSRYTEKNNTPRAQASGKQHGASAVPALTCSPGLHLIHSTPRCRAPRRQLVTAVWAMGALQIGSLVTERLWDSIERQVLKQASALESAMGLSQREDEAPHAIACGSALNSKCSEGW